MSLSHSLEDLLAAGAVAGCQVPCLYPLGYIHFVSPPLLVWLIRF